jgi:hypothetical protein
MTLARDVKTPAQLQREIAYYAAQLQRTTSADRQRRCHVAIRKREQQLAAARQLQTSAAKDR